MQFKKVQRPDLMTGGQKTRWVLDVAHEDLQQVATPTFFIEATTKGVEIAGDMELSSMAELQHFAKIISDAWKEHKRLAPRLGQNAAGH